MRWCRWHRSTGDTTVTAESQPSLVPVYLHHCGWIGVDYQTHAPVERCRLCGEVGHACMLNRRGVVGVVSE